PLPAPDSAPVAAKVDRPADENDRATPRAVTEAPAGNEEAPRRRLGPPPFAWVAGGVAVTGLVAGGSLTYWGSQDNSELQRTCSPYCKASAVSHVKAMYVASDVSFAVGAVAAAVAVGLFVAPRYDSSKAQT